MDVEQKARRCYTVWGSLHGGCGHSHKSIQSACGCLRNYLRRRAFMSDLLGGVADRRVFVLYGDPKTFRPCQQCGLNLGADENAARTMAANHVCAKKILLANDHE